MCTIFSNCRYAVQMLRMLTCIQAYPYTCSNKLDNVAVPAVLENSNLLPYENFSLLFQGREGQHTLFISVFTVLGAVVEYFDCHHLDTSQQTTVHLQGRRADHQHSFRGLDTVVISHAHDQSYCCLLFTPSCIKCRHPSLWYSTVLGLVTPLSWHLLNRR